MNTNSNVYTIVYTTVVVAVVAAALAFVSLKLGPAQQANAKAETLRQMMAAAKVSTTDELYAAKNAQVLKLYSDNIDKAFTINENGDTTATLSTDLRNIELRSGLKGIGKAIRNGGSNDMPVYVFKGGITVIPVYGAGLWGPIWGYVAFEQDACTIKGAFFDHESETPGLGAKIKDEPWFREKFEGKKIAFGAENLFNLAKNAESQDPEHSVDAITGATMTSKGLNGAINDWFRAYEKFLKASAPADTCATCIKTEE